MTSLAASPAAGGGRVGPGCGQCFHWLIKHLIHPDGLLILLISAKIHQVYESVLDFCHFPLVSISVSPNVSAGFGKSLGKSFAPS